MTRFKKTVAIDFDGVIHRHISPWTVPHEIHDGPVPGAFEFLEQVLDEFNVVIFSARAADPEGRIAIRNWLLQHAPFELRNGGVEITAQKPHAFIYIDDRGWRFEGRFPTMDEIRSFESWTRRTEVQRRKKIQELETRRLALRQETDAVVEEIRLLWLEDSKTTRQCACLRLNSDIDVRDMADAVARRRQTFGIGLVAEQISADKDCPLCHGTGVK